MLESGQILCVREASLQETRYQLQQKLGHNAGRQTWLAAVETQPNGGSVSVILKLLAFSPQMQWEDFKLFERESLVLKDLNHPQIPQYRDSFSLDKYAGAGLSWFGLVQEYIPGASLQELLKQGKRFTEEQVIAYATDILNVLIYLHDLSPAVLHRDIKPSNLILGEDDKIYLVDFGAVQNQAAAEGVSFTVVGTSGYAPLEQFWGRAVPASDLYALGASLIHLLTGTPPADLPSHNLRIQFGDKVSLNPALVRWIEALTEPDIDKRFSTARQALTALQTGRLRIPSLKIPQPTRSRVQIWKSATQLKVRIPGGWKSLAENIISIVSFIIKLFIIVSSRISAFFLALIIAILIVGALACIVYINIIGLLILVPLILILIWLFRSVNRELKGKLTNLKLPRFTALGDYCLSLDSDRFTIERRIFGFCYFRHQGQISHITEVKNIPFKALTLQARKVKHVFGQNLTESEREWLAQEIQNWLY